MSSIIAHGRRNFKSALSRSHIVAQLLEREQIERHGRTLGHRWRRSFWSPGMTLLAMLLQAAGGVKTLRAAVAQVLAHLLLQGDGRCVHGRSGDPSALAQARQRLPVAVIDAVFRHSVTLARDLAGAASAWRGLRVIVIDGCTVSMPDTAPLQKAFPQPKGQSAGCGFPIARIVTLFDWRSGAALDHRMGSQHDSEAALFRQMLDHFTAGVVALADRYYCSYVDIARILQRGGDVVFRMHQRRSHDFRTGARLDDDDALVTWHRPKWIPSFGLAREELERLPEQLTLRMLRTRRGEAIKGFRSRTIVIITTLLDPEEAPRDELLALYRDRWRAELNIRSLKTTMGMEFLRGRSVDVVRKEVLTHLLLYNLIRLLMWEAARTRGRDPQRLSFAGTLHRLQSLGIGVLTPAGRRSPRLSQAHLAALLRWIADDVVPDRPNRFEPRRVKRRPKNYSRLTRLRTHYHTHGDPSCR